ncbi:hypothetical protein MMC18_003921 [Xylographa bjoerkii]|nr:hypothetical protein [Xylographa bjoerkii]
MIGTPLALAANRISHFFDLRGASLTLDTGCLSGLIALYQAVLGLRAGEADMAVVSGYNLMLLPDRFKMLLSLGMLSPDGRSYAFNTRADGYGRGEGVVTIIIKRLRDALAAGDPVRAIIRETGLNQDGKTDTIIIPATVVPAEHWKRKLHAAGFGYVDWTDGDLPEHAYHKVIVAMASGAQGPRLPKPAPAAAFNIDKGDVAARTATAEALVAKYSTAWATPALEIKHAKLEKGGNSSSGLAPKLGDVVLVTGGTGSLGCHIVQSLAENPTVAQVVCLNRPSAVAVDKRQHDILRMRGIAVTPGVSAKVRALATDMAQQALGLAPHEHAWLLQHATYIVYNTWPIGGTRPLIAFTSSPQAMRNLLNLARDMAVRDDYRRLAFLFVSSIGAVGCSAEPRVFEERLPLAVALPNGYGEVK